MATHSSKKITRPFPQKLLPIVGIPVLSICALTAQADGPTYSFLNTFDTATVDGSYTTDWPQPLPPITPVPQTPSTSTTIHVPMWEAGDPYKNNAVQLSDLYLRYDCDSETMFALVLKKPGHSISLTNDPWITINSNSNKVVNSSNNNLGISTDNPPELSWVPPSTTPIANTEGYEASFELTPNATNPYRMEVHVNIDDNGRTSSSGRGDNFIYVNPICPTESLAIHKEANPFYTEEYDWTITKTVDPDNHTMFIGDTAQTSTYTVTVDQTVTPTGQKVTGEITIANNTASKTAKIASVVDTITPGDIPVTVDCGVTFPYDLAAGQTLICSYTQTLDSAFNGTNEVIVVPANGSELFGGQATHNFAFDANTPIEATGYPTVDVVDTKEGVLQADLGGDHTFTYTHDFSCPTDPDVYVNGKYEENYDNVASIQKTEEGNTTVIASDDAAVVKTCYAPSVEKTAIPSITETLGWTLDKAVDKTELSMNAGESSPVNYTVTVGTAIDVVDYAVNGTITVTNPHPTQPITVSVTDMLTGNINATVDCGEGSTELTVAGDSFATCDYSANLPNSDERTNIATATFNNINFNSPQVTFNFAEVVATVVGPTPPLATVTDTTPDGKTELGSTSSPTTYPYDKTLTCPTDPADYQNGHHSFTYPNTAAIEGTGKTANAEVTVHCYAPTVRKTADPAIEQTLGWTLEKTVTPDHLAMNIGAAGENVHYTVTLGTEPIADLTKYTVTGDIVVTNTNPNQPMTVTIADNLPGSTNMVLTCDGGTNTPTIPANGGEVNCTYSADLPDGSDRENIATATLNGLVMSSAPAPINFSEVTPTDTGPTPSPAKVFDTNTPEGSFWSATGPDEWTYDVTLTCSNNPADYTNGHYSFPHPNMATIEDTDKSANANVTVDCYAPLVSKNATPAFTRTYDWSIDKIANITPNDILLQVGQTYNYTYDIIVDVTGHNDTEVTVAGDITVQNPSTEDAMDVSVIDHLSGVDATLDCGGALSVPAGSSLPCHYEIDLADNSTGSNLTNTATVTLNNVQFEATANVNFGAPTTEIDECVEVTDQIAANEPWTVGTELETLGTACVSDGLPNTFTYGPFTVGPYDSSMASNCQLPDNPTAWIDNTATFTTNDNSNMDSDDEHVPVCLPQNDSCTLTQGYWKTHSIHGPAPISEGWIGTAPTLVEGEIVNQAGNVADFTFFLSGQTYYQVLWTPPKGNAYYNLAHQWIATYLNQMNGASMPAEVLTAFNEAWTLLATYAPNQVSGNVAKQFRTWYPILDNYNNGLVGPGHCSDDSILFGG